MDNSSPIMWRKRRRSPAGHTAQRHRGAHQGSQNRNSRRDAPRHSRRLNQRPPCNRGFH
jgi:hypothetical protein